MTDNSLESLSADLQQLITKLPELEHGRWIQRALAVLLRITGEEIERLDWKILTAALEDMEGAFQVFYKYHHILNPSLMGNGSTQI